MYIVFIIIIIIINIFFIANYFQNKRNGNDLTINDRNEIISGDISYKPIMKRIRRQPVWMNYD